MGKNVKFEPFGGSTSPHIFDEDMECIKRYEKGLDEMDLGELIAMKEEIEESIADADTIIDIELDTVRSHTLYGQEADTENLQSARQQRQQLVVELRAIKKAIKMMMKNENESEVAAA